VNQGAPHRRALAGSLHRFEPQDPSKGSWGSKRWRASRWPVLGPDDSLHGNPGCSRSARPWRGGPGLPAAPRVAGAGARGCRISLQRFSTKAVPFSPWGQAGPRPRLRAACLPTRQRPAVGQLGLPGLLRRRPSAQARGQLAVGPRAERGCGPLPCWHWVPRPSLRVAVTGRAIFLRPSRPATRSAPTEGSPGGAARGRRSSRPSSELRAVGCHNLVSGGSQVL